jgi:hypothetical protein
MARLLARLLDLHPALTFVIMAVAFAGFSLLTYNVFALLSANLDYVGRGGLMALMDGAARQLVEIVASIVGGLAFYIVFKACERLLVERLTRR